MPREFTPKVVTASDLLEGDVIYLAADDSWVRELKDAEVLTDEADAQLRQHHPQSPPHGTLGAYPADVAVTENGPAPTHFREDFRRTGPSNYAHGKQEAHTDV